MSGIRKAFADLISKAKRKRRGKKPALSSTEVKVILGYVQEEPMKGHPMKLFRTRLTNVDSQTVIPSSGLYSTSVVVAIQKLDENVYRVFTEELMCYYIVEVTHDSSKEIVIGNICEEPVKSQKMKVVKTTFLDGHTTYSVIETDKVVDMVYLYSHVIHVTTENGGIYLLEVM